MPKILLVDDEEINRDPLSRRLKRRGYEVMTAADADQAVATARQEQPELILMDIGLPGKDGYQATAELKADSATLHIPIIALTGFVMEDELNKALEVGCNDYDTKPVDLARLLRKMEALLGSSET